MHPRPKFITFIGYLLFVVSVFFLVKSLWLYDPHPNTFSPLAPPPLGGWFILNGLISLGILLVSSVLILRGIDWGRWLFIVHFIYHPIIQHFGDLQHWKIELGIGERALVLVLLFLPAADGYFQARYKTNE